MSSSGGLDDREGSRGPLPRRIGPYAVLRELGRGSMGVVYLGRGIEDGREVAVKVIGASRLASPSARERFRREARLLQRVRHPNVIRVHDVGEDGGVLWYSMDVVEGESLEERVRREGPLPHPEACELVRDLALAVFALHEQGILHRDLKPANVLVERTSGRPLLADFGLAFDLDAEDAKRLTKTGASVGTPTFMSPEQLRAERDLDARADVYGLGGILYHALTGSDPFVCETLEELVQKALETLPVPPSRLAPGVPRAVDAACLRALAKDRDDRHATARLLALDLDDASGARVERAAPRSRLLLHLAGGATAALLAVAPLLADELARRERLREDEARRPAEATLAVLLEARKKALYDATLVARNHVTEGDALVAQREVERGLRLDPRDPRLLALHARALLFKNFERQPDAGARLAQARADLETARALAPSDPGVLMGLAVLRFSEGEGPAGQRAGMALLRAALEPERRADRRDQLDAADLSQCFVGPTERDFQLEWVDRTLAAVPDWAYAHLVKARVLASHDDAAAEVELTRVVALDPSRTQARYERAAVRARRGDLAGARDDYRAVLELAPESSEVAFRLGWVEERLGNESEAMRLYDRSLDHAEAGKGWPVRQRRARLRRARGNLEGALEDIRSVLAEADLAEYHALHGQLLGELGRHAEARVAYEKALALSPAHVPAIVGLADCRENLEGPHAAAETYAAAAARAVRPESRAALEDFQRRAEKRADERRARWFEDVEERARVARTWLAALGDELHAVSAYPDGPARLAWCESIRERLARLQEYQDEAARIIAVGAPPAGSARGR